MSASFSFAATFPLDPAKFAYTKEVVTAKRESRAFLPDQQLFYDLVLTEVAQIRDSAKLYPPRTLSDLRILHQAILNCPVDLLKKQCCIYYMLRDWNMHEQYAEEQLMPWNYCRLMDSYWYLDNGKYSEALVSLTSPGLTPNFATKIMQTFEKSGNGAMIVTYVQTIQNALDTEEKIGLYLRALMKLDLRQSFIFTRTTDNSIRQKLFLQVLEFAQQSQAAALKLADYPFDQDEEKWLYEALSQRPGLGLEALVLRLTHLGERIEVLRLRNKFGGGQPAITNALRSVCHDVELKTI